VFGAGDKIVAEYSPGPHDFPPAARSAAYAFLARHLSALQPRRPFADRRFPEFASSIIGSGVQLGRLTLRPISARVVFSGWQ
jgi:hypothetical protein